VIARILVAVLVAAASLLIGGCPTLHPVGAHTSHGRIVSVADGDTVTVRLDSGKTKSVRLLAIDSPEKYAARYGTPAECGSLAASAFMERFEGRRVVLISDPTQDDVDRYGRLLRYAQLESGEDLGARALARGMAIPYVYGAPARRAAHYHSLALAARAAGRGSWGPSCAGDFHTSLPGVQDGLDE